MSEYLASVRRRRLTVPYTREELAAKIRVLREKPDYDKRTVSLGFLAGVEQLLSDSSPPASLPEEIQQ